MPTTWQRSPASLTQPASSTASRVISRRTAGAGLGRVASATSNSTRANVLRLQSARGDRTGASRRNGQEADILGWGQSGSTITPLQLELLGFSLALRSA